MNEFRVWDKKEKKMYYDGFLIGTDGELYRIVNMFENLDYTYDSNLMAVNQENYEVMHCLSGRKDQSCGPVYNKDILRYETGYEFCIEYGTHDAFCPGDKIFGTNEGFVAAIYDPVTGSDHHEVYPLMDIETLALVVGNVFEGYQIGKNSALKEVQDMLE